MRVSDRQVDLVHIGAAAPVVAPDGSVVPALSLLGTREDANVRAMSTRSGSPPRGFPSTATSLAPGLAVTPEDSWLSVERKASGGATLAAPSVDHV
jgi:hypothetical protein